MDDQATEETVLNFVDSPDNNFNIYILSPIPSICCKSRIRKSS